MDTHVYRSQIYNTIMSSIYYIYSKRKAPICITELNNLISLANNSVEYLARALCISFGRSVCFSDFKPAFVTNWSVCLENVQVGRLSLANKTRGQCFSHACLQSPFNIIGLFDDWPDGNWQNWIHFQISGLFVDVNSVVHKWQVNHWSRRSVDLTTCREAKTYKIACINPHCASRIRVTKQMDPLQYVQAYRVLVIDIPSSGNTMHWQQCRNNNAITTKQVHYLTNPLITPSDKCRNMLIKKYRDKHAQVQLHYPPPPYNYFTWRKQFVILVDDHIYMFEYWMDNCTYYYR